MIAQEKICTECTGRLNLTPIPQVIIKSLRTQLDYSYICSDRDGKISKCKSDLIKRLNRHLDKTRGCLKIWFANQN